MLHLVSLPDGRGAGRAAPGAQQSHQRLSSPFSGGDRLKGAVIDGRFPAAVCLSACAAYKGGPAEPPGAGTPILNRDGQISIAAPSSGLGRRGRRGSSASLPACTRNVARGAGAAPERPQAGTIRRDVPGFPVQRPAQLTPRCSHHGSGGARADPDQPVRRCWELRPGHSEPSPNDESHQGHDPGVGTSQGPRTAQGGGRRLAVSASSESHRE